MKNLSFQRQTDGKRIKDKSSYMSFCQCAIRQLSSCDRIKIFLILKVSKTTYKTLLLLPGPDPHFADQDPGSGKNANPVPGKKEKERDE